MHDEDDRGHPHALAPARGRHGDPRHPGHHAGSSAVRLHAEPHRPASSPGASTRPTSCASSTSPRSPNPPPRFSPPSLPLTARSPRTKASRPCSCASSAPTSRRACSRRPRRPLRGRRPLPSRTRDRGTRRRPHTSDSARVPKRQSEGRRPRCPGLPRASRDVAAASSSGSRRWSSPSCEQPWIFRARKSKIASRSRRTNSALRELAQRAEADRVAHGVAHQRLAVADRRERRACGATARRARGPGRRRSGAAGPTPGSTSASRPARRAGAAGTG